MQQHEVANRLRHLPYRREREYEERQAHEINTQESRNNKRGQRLGQRIAAPGAVFRLEQRADVAALAALADQGLGKLELLHAPPLCEDAHALAIGRAAALVHLRIDPRRVAPERRLDHVRALQQFCEVERGEKAQRGYAVSEHGGVDAVRHCGADLGRQRKAQGGREEAKLPHREGQVALKIREVSLRALRRDGAAALAHQGRAGGDYDRAAVRGAQPPRAAQLRGRELALALYEIPVVEQPVRARGQVAAAPGEPVVLPAYGGERARHLPGERAPGYGAGAGFGHVYHLSFCKFARVTFPRPGASYTGGVLKKNT